jgi:hypothetical protein
MIKRFIFWIYNMCEDQLELVGKRDCICGKRNYRTHKHYSVIYCIHCGLAYEIIGVRDPIAVWALTEGDTNQDEHAAIDANTSSS